MASAFRAAALLVCLLMLLHCASAILGGLASAMFGGSSRRRHSSASAAASSSFSTSQSAPSRLRAPAPAPRREPLHQRQARRRRARRAPAALPVRPGADLVAPDPGLQRFLVSTFSCDANTTFDACVSGGVSSLFSTVGTGLTLVLVTGEFPETKIGPLVVSGKNIELSGLDTLSAADVSVQAMTLYLTMLLKEMDMSGDLTLKIPILGRRTVHVALSVRGLRAPTALVLAASAEKLMSVKDFNVRLSFDTFDVELNRGRPLVSRGVPFSGLINGLANNLLKAFTSKSVLENKILPLVTRLLKPTLLELVNGLLEASQTS